MAFVDRKEKSITKSTVELAFEKVLEMEERVPGPKKLGCFGGSYLYPVFIWLGVIVNKLQSFGMLEDCLDQSPQLGV